MKRVRDYRAEELRRNERARALGFKTRAQQRAAVKRGEVASARARKADPKVEEREARRDTARRAGFANPTQYRKARSEANAWVKSHSRQPVTRKVPTDPQEFAEFYDAFVRSWGRKRGAYDAAALRAYLINHNHVTPEQWEDSYESSTRHWS